MATASVLQNLVVDNENSPFGTRSLRMQTVASSGAVKIAVPKEMFAISKFRARRRLTIHFTSTRWLQPKSVITRSLSVRMITPIVRWVADVTLVAALARTDIAVPDKDLVLAAYFWSQPIPISKKSSKI